MWIADNWKDYKVIDCSDGEKLERWGEYTLIRPDPQVLWSFPRKDRDGGNGTDITTEAAKAVVNGSSGNFRNSGRFTMEN